MAIRPARLDPLALSASGPERMVNGPAAARGQKRQDLSNQIAWFGNMLSFGVILTERDRSSRSCPVRSLPIRMSVDGSSQRGQVCARPEPAGGAWSERTVASGTRTVASSRWSVASECKAGKITRKEKLQNKAILPVVLIICML